ncbi:FtsQ-type POTRA domain-containing protein [Kocuria rhizophila]|uniref:cell division protein FtsQ/DivIB n=1 Tax=Kocuria rhizophila TaxID=72000 RepID=UPI0029491988|nr:FtsQ-type POTRA domain-containing protein [Kocuria rhizophila]MDV5999375.1 FtsQ-type POTRA domain-containing protein [Kocuria rhizophila]
MARSTPPHQPPADGRGTPAGDDDAARAPLGDSAASGEGAGLRAGSTAYGSSVPGAERGGPGGRLPEDVRGAEDRGGSETPRVHVNDGSKVSRVDPGQLEAVPEAGGRFSSWRARRRAARAEDAAAADGAGQAGPEPGEGGSTVLQFPPSPHRTRRRRRLLTLLVSLLVLLALAVAVFFSPLFATRTIDVQGARLTDPQRVQDALSGYQGVPMTRISAQDVKDSVGDVPQVKSVDVAFRPPHTISVHLHERVGVAVVKDGANLVLVDSEGKPLDTVPAERRPDVPLVDGGRDVLSTQKFQDISDVLAALPADVLARLDSAAAPSGSAVELTLKDGKKVVWGDARDSEVKSQVVAALVNSRTMDGATEIDVSAPGHPVVK